jgi:6-phosphogluconolactonase
MDPAFSDETPRPDGSTSHWHRDWESVSCIRRIAGTIAVYEIDPAKSTLKLVEHASTEGKTPRNFTFVPSGNWLIAGNEMSDILVGFKLMVFKVDAETSITLLSS